MVLSLTKNSLDYNTPKPSDHLPEKLFGTDGIRGKVGELLTPNLALQVGLAAGSVWQEFKTAQGVVIIGQDSRNSSDMLSMAITSGLTSLGLEVWNIGLCPTPCVAYLTKTTEAIGGIMISASHNPPEDNGIKFFGSEGTKLDKLLTSAIENTLRKNIDGDINYQDGKCGKILQQHHLVQNYAHFLKTSLPPNLDFSGMRIVLDLAWGASVELAPSIFQALGAEVIALHPRGDGDRINVNCGSTHLNKLQEAVQKYQGDLGFAFDGDADRVMAVDAQGRIICGDYILYLWGKYLKERDLLPDNLLVSTVMANLGFELAWKKLGGKFLRTAVGDQYVQAAMWETGAMLGGEQSGHILCHHHHFSGDGIQTALQLTSLVRQQGDCLVSLVNDSFIQYPQVLKNIRVENREKRLNWQDCTPLQNAITKAEEAMGNEGRVLVRPSGTEPLMRVMVEAQNENLVNYWIDYLVKIVEENFMD
ncbi:MAG: phosphoglucosamine mutase [Cyanobacteria bacterium]|nr:phosphoglucosamine mutase [Cyanobacteria bacterium CG_2015-16_32_12]NCO76884.1 phosphoglucosamine mutase [Cyanobacteria bacterium CG_2015-22_32_23]NCQ03367.1 phosphoglucosamine mutase [Cyanobacteria bacterium CG_2015-09_32_10]NCQ40578.1 phosphoglucosamine mutase [Cyanobacteria bacterium CG_2015-04_32_10]NCS84384.1 phosphoglucosamine mutase [Cyanobacteria bacterium CG_2015-02_32_10]